MDEWIKKKIWLHTYNGIIFSHKKEQDPVTATWKSLEDIMLSEVSQVQNNNYCISHSYMKA